MKNLLTILICLSLIIGTLSAQTPNAFKYQAVVRNNAGQIIVSQTVGFRISILQNSVSGTVVFSEKHTALTNAFGLVNLEIGNGTNVTGTFSTINWGIGSYFVKIELDANNSGAFSEMGTSQLLSVPYSLYAKQAGNGFSGSWLDLTNKPNVLILAANPLVGEITYYNGTSWQLLQKGINGQTLRLDNGLPKWGEPGYTLPIVTTIATADIMTTAATSGGYVVSPGYTEITAKGVCWAITQNPTTANDKTSDGTGSGSFSSAIKNLQTNTSYYVRAYATNGAGTAYGNQVTFKTFQNIVFPTVTTTAITNVTANSVTSGGNITATGGSEVTARGVCWSDHQNPVITDSKTDDSTGAGQFQSQISGLIPGTYYARAYATNSAGTGYGNMVTITTEKTLPVLTTKTITDISAMGAVSGGNITTAGGGTISGRGICWSELPNPTITDEISSSPSITSSFNAAITKAKPGTTYYLRAYATNEVGTSYGDQKTFTTSDAAYYQSFETGLMPTGWTGDFKVNAESAFEGSYSLKSLDATECDASFTITLANAGQLSFYYAFSDGSRIGVFIDDVSIQNFPNNGGGWQQGLVNITAGTHKITWHSYPYCPLYCTGKCYIDQIIITK